MLSDEFQTMRLLPKSLRNSFNSRLAILSVATLLTILPRLDTFAQDINLGRPPTQNYSKKTYRAGTQNWDIRQADNGVMYFANNDGLLEFDGVHWRLMRLSNGTIVRSVAIAEDGKIYAGGQGEMGYFYPDQQGRLVYQSIKHLVPAEFHNFEDVWDIIIHEEGIFFRTNNQLFRLKDGKIDALISNRPLIFVGILNNKILTQDAASNLMILENGRLEPVKLTDQPIKFSITAILPLSPDTQLVTTIKHGVFHFTNNKLEKWVTPHDAQLEASRIYCAALLNDGKLALGTSLDGLYILDRQRRILQHLNKEKDLQNNTVLSAFTDRTGNLWLGLDNGIDYVQINSPFTTIYPDGKLQGTGYTASIHQNEIFFGTNTGLYYTDWKDYYPPSDLQHYKMVSNTSGQIWGLSTIGDELLAGLHDGPFSIAGGAALQMGKMPGTWTFLQLSDRLALSGHYNGLSLFKKVQGRWRFDSNLDGISESCRILVKDDAGNIWVSHPYRGVYKVEIDTTNQSVEVAFFNSSNGLPSDLNNYVYILGGKPVFATEKGIYNYNQASGSFEPNENFNRIFGRDDRVKYLRQDANGNIWYVAGNETGVLWVENKALEKDVKRMPIQDLSGRLVGGFEFILPVNEDNVFFATEQGFIHFKPKRYLSDTTKPTLVLHSVSLEHRQDSILFGGYFPADGGTEPIQLPHNLNALRFQYCATDFSGIEFVKYAHYLEGSDSEWSAWDEQTSLVYNNLRPGNYTLHMKAINKNGIESETITWSFEIVAPWYANNLAYALYAFMLAGGIGAVMFSQRRRFEKEKAHLQTTHEEKVEEHKLRVQQSEAVITNLRNEKLKAEVDHKNRELATATMHLVQKSELMTTIRQSLEKLGAKTRDQPELFTEIKRLIKAIEQDTSLDEDWEHFSQYFDEVHSDFLKRLGEQFPQLSPNDFKLCAYLRMNLSSKEIASLMNISVRGVEASRYRLRKRLELATDVNLTEFLMRL